MTSPIRIREAKPGDMAFVRDAWRRSYEPESIVYRINRSTYARLMDIMMDRLLDEPGAKVRIAVDAKDDDTFVAFAVMREPELHYVYVKHDFRRQGLVPDMLKDAVIHSHTFLTKLGNERLRPHARGWGFHPRCSL